MRGHLAAAKAAGMPVSRQQHHRCACRHHLHHVSHCPPLLYTASGIRSSYVLPPPYLPDAALHVEGSPGPVACTSRRGDPHYGTRVFGNS